MSTRIRVIRWNKMLDAADIWNHHLSLAKSSVDSFVSQVVPLERDTWRHPTKEGHFSYVNHFPSDYRHKFDAHCEENCVVVKFVKRTWNKKLVCVLLTVKRCRKCSLPRFFWHFLTVFCVQKWPTHTQKGKNFTLS